MPEDCTIISAMMPYVHVYEYVTEIQFQALCYCPMDLSESFKSLCTCNLTKMFKKMQLFDIASSQYITPYVSNDAAY